jgi:4-hydroxy-tetrahydrodipicolinate synthase
MQPKLKGTGVALVTPFDENQEVDFKGLEKLLTHTSQGVDYFVVLGTTGETATTTAEEKKEILRFVKENNPKKLPIVYGMGGNNTGEVLKNIEATNFEGVDAILSVSPYYNKPSQEGIVEHYSAIADKSPVPVILYNVPGRTGSNMHYETTLRLTEHENIIGIKEASGDLEQAMQIARHKPDDFLLISGDDMLTVPMMAVGAEGVISVLANAFPKIFKEMIHSALDGDFRTAQRQVFKLMDINPLMYSESNPVGIKHVLTSMGICDNYVRLPLVPASGGLQTRINELVQNVLNK